MYYVWEKAGTVALRVLCSCSVFSSLVTCGDLLLLYCGLTLLWTVLTHHGIISLMQTHIHIHRIIPLIYTFTAFVSVSSSCKRYTLLLFDINERHVLLQKFLLLIHSPHCSRRGDWILNGCDYDLLSEFWARSDRGRCADAKPAVLGYEWVLANPSSSSLKQTLSVKHIERWKPLDHSVGS